MVAPSQPLAQFLAFCRDWHSVPDLRAAATDYLRARPQSEIELIRERRGPVKRVADEIFPLLGFLELEAVESEVRFSLGNDTPDAWVRDGAGAVSPFEITVAQAREQIHLGRELNGTGQGRGFLGLSDLAPQASFDAALRVEAGMYRPDEAFSSVEAGVRLCLKKKNEPRYKGMTLLVEAPMHMEKHRWQPMKSRLQAHAATMPFDRIYVINDRDDCFGFFIK